MSQSRRDRQGAQQQALAEQQTAQRRHDRRLLAGGVLAVVLVLIVVGIGFQSWRTNRAPDAGTVIPGPAVPVTIADGRPISWGADAPVTVDLYEDFHCPHCAEFEEEYGQLLADAQAAGSIKLRIFPMSFIDAGSATAANGFACAAESGFGPAFYTGLFANQNLGWSDSQLNQLAERATGTVPADFSTCVAQRRHAAWTDSIDAAAAAVGVTGTPTMFLGGQQIDITTLTPDSLKTMIEEAAQK